MTTESLPNKRFGVKRWIVLACIILGAYLQFGPLPTIAPNVVLPGEKIGHPPINIPIINQPLTNTLVATLLTDIVVLSLGFSLCRCAASCACSRSCALSCSTDFCISDAAFSAR